MRQERTVQASLFDRFADHEIGRELKSWQSHPAPSPVPQIGVASPWTDLRRDRPAL